MNDKVGRPRRANSSFMWGCARSEARPADQPPSTLTGRFALFLPHGPVAFRIRLCGAPRDGVEVLGEEEPGRDHPLKPQQLPLSVLHRIQPEPSLQSSGGYALASSSHGALKGYKRMRERAKKELRSTKYRSPGRRIRLDFWRGEYMPA